jgi:hypothetical protein
LDCRHWHELPVVAEESEEGCELTDAECVLCSSDSQLLKWKIKGNERIVCDDCISECWRITQFFNPDDTRWKLLDILDLSIENYSHFLRRAEV